MHWIDSHHNSGLIWDSSKSNYKEHCRLVPDFPKKGIMFRDITPLLSNGEMFSNAINDMANMWRQVHITTIVAIEARGFLIGSALAYKMNIGIIPVRKKGKLPYKTHSIEYDLEYGKDLLEIHQDAISNDDKILLVDDILATGGTASAVTKMISKNGGNVIGATFLLEIQELHGQEKLQFENKSLIVKSLILD